VSLQRSRLRAALFAACAGSPERLSPVSAITASLFTRRCRSRSVALLYQRDCERITVTLDALGRMVVVGETGQVELASVPAQRLLAHLVLRPEISRREVIADRLWPEGADPGGSLRGALGKLRDSLGAAANDILRVDRVEIALVDRDSFAANVLELLDTAGAEDEDRPIRDLLALTPEALFAGLNDPWIVDAREAYLERIVAILRHAATGLTAAGDMKGALRVLRRRVKLEPRSHEAQLGYLQALRASGEVATAVSQYNAFRIKLQKEGLVPSQELRSLYEELLAEDAEGERQRPSNVATPQWARPHAGWLLLAPESGQLAARGPTYQSYAARFLALSFTELVRELPAIERMIRDDALAAFTERLRKQASDIRGDVAWLGGVMVRVAIGTSANASELLVTLESLGSVQPRLTITREVAHFGVTRVVRLDAPRALQRHGEDLADDLARRYREAYVALEAAYLATYKRWVASAYDLLYEVVNVQLRIHAADKAIGRFWFSITDLPTTTFRYHIDPSGVKAAIEHLKALGSSGLPAWLAVTSLILDEVPDGVFGAENSCRVVHVEGGTTVMRFDAPVILLRFDDAPTLGSNTQFWLSERILYQSDEIAALDIATENDLTLQANCPIEHASPVAAAIEAVREDLATAFGRSLDVLVTQRAALAAVVASHHVSFDARIL
jgi:DNA-binding SARP family transcriptional activator